MSSTGAGYNHETLAGSSRMDRLMLLDSASLYFRAFFGVPDSVKAPDGTPVNAVRGFLDMVATLVRTRRPGRLVCALDEEWRPAWRGEVIPSYKTHPVLGGAPGAPGGAPPPGAPGAGGLGGPARVG